MLSNDNNILKSTAVRFKYVDELDHQFQVSQSIPACPAFDQEGQDLWELLS